MLQTKNLNLYIPAIPNSNSNAIGQDSEYDGRVKYNLQLVEAPCLTFVNGDSLNNASITSSSIVENSGTAIGTPSTGFITFTAGTIYELKVDGKLYPCCEGYGSSVFASDGTELTITSSTSYWANTQDNYFYEAIYGYYIDSSDVHYVYKVSSTTFVEGDFWNNSNNKYQLPQAKVLIEQDKLEGPFWFDGSYNPIAKTQDEIQTYASDKAATFFCAEKGKGLVLYQEILTGDELAEAIAFFRTNCNG